jgi:hypothetical protein
MPDKKTCENCGMQTKEWCIPLKVCDKWTRNPRLWLSILPEEPGWYWYREDSKHVPTIAEVERGSSGVLTVGWDILQPIGQWQGPIRPEGE